MGEKWEREKAEMSEDQKEDLDRLRQQFESKNKKMLKEQELLVTTV